MKIFWGQSLTTPMGNAFGYSVHHGSMRKALAEIGVENTFASDVAVHIATAYVFKPVPGKKNILFTMYETTSLPQDWIPIIRQADALMVPCRHNRDLFRNYFDGPIYVIPEGVDPLYQFRLRRAPGPAEKFRWLWVGAPNLRKGFAALGAAWARWITKYPKFAHEHELVLKTSGIVKNQEVHVRPEWGMIVDPIKSTAEGMRDLYYRAHAFILPSLGEGWGLTLSEAAATGLPCIYTPWSGPRDFMDERYSYPVRWRFGEVQTVKAKGVVDHVSNAAIPDVEHIVRRMEQIYFGYPEALRRGALMSARLHREFTWWRSAEIFCEVLRDFASRTGADIGEPGEAIA